MGGRMAQTNEVDSLPKVWSALMAINTKSLTGTLSVQTEIYSATINVSNGKVVNLISPDFSPEKVIDVLNRMRVLSAEAVIKANKVAERENIKPTQAAINLQLAQESTVSRVQEFLLKEALLQLMMDETAEVSFARELPGSIAHALRMPIPFLLKEAQKRQKEWPAIKTKVPFMRAVFKRKTATDPVTGNKLAWEDLPLQGVEKIVYFFLDGDRTVSQIADSAFISEFDSARAIYSLLNRDLAVKVTYYQDENKEGKIKKSKGGLAISIAYIIFFVIMGLIGFGLSNVWMGKLAPHNINKISNLMEEQSRERLNTAMSVFKIRNGRWPEDFNELLEAKLALPGDKKAALVTKKVGKKGYLYEGDETH